MSFSFHRDGDFIDNSSSASLTASLVDNGLIEKDGQVTRIAYCGLVVADDEFHIFFPKGFSSQNNNSVENARLLMDCIFKYTSTHGRHVYMDDIGETEVTGTPLPLARQLLQDYLKHGLYRVNTSIDRKRYSGKINWNKTINSIVPSHNRNNEFVYPEFYTKHFNYSVDNTVTQIHASIISSLDQKYGWWVSGNTRGVAPELHGIHLDMAPHQAVRAIRKEMNKVFSDREINLLKNLIIFLEKHFMEGDENVTVSGITNFEHLWEHICSVVFGNESERYSKIIPVPGYITKGKISRMPQNKQRMDIIIHSGDKTAILDAKYYDMSVTKPRWGDLVKQFYYKTSLEAVSSDEISNYFVVPDLDNFEIPELAVVLDVDDSSLDDDFPPINILSVDVLSVMRAYMGKESRDEYRNLIFND